MLVSLLSNGHPHVAVTDPIPRVVDLNPRVVAVVVDLTPELYT